MIRRLIALTVVAFLALGIAAAPGARAEQRIATDDHWILCVGIDGVNGWCVANPIRRLP